MQDRGDLRQFVFKVAAASRQDKKRWRRFRETLDTAILGTLSASLGVVVLVVGVLGMMGVAHIGWGEQLRGQPQLSPILPILVSIGEVLGLAGLAFGRIRRGTISPLCAAGTIVCLIPMFLHFGHSLFLSFF